MSNLPTDSAARKALPITTGVLDYFPDAIAAVAAVSVFGNNKHNPGQPLHWAREKSTDHADCVARHLIERDHVDKDGFLGWAYIAWRALAGLQLAIEARRALPTGVSGRTEIGVPSGPCDTCFAPTYVVAGVHLCTVDWHHPQQGKGWPKNGSIMDRGNADIGRPPAFVVRWDDLGLSSQDQDWADRNTA